MVSTLFISLEVRMLGKIIAINILLCFRSSKQFGAVRFQGNPGRPVVFVKTLKTHPVIESPTLAKQFFCLRAEEVCLHRESPVGSV